MIGCNPVPLGFNASNSMRRVPQSPHVSQVTRLLENLACFAPKMSGAYCAVPNNNDLQDMNLVEQQTKSKSSRHNVTPHAKGRPAYNHRRHDESFLYNDDDDDNNNVNNLVVPDMIQSSQEGSSHSKGTSSGSDYSSSFGDNTDLNTLGSKTAHAMKFVQTKPPNDSAKHIIAPCDSPNSTQKTSNKYASIRKRLQYMRLQQKFSGGSSSSFSQQVDDPPPSDSRSSAVATSIKSAQQQYNNNNNNNVHARRTQLAKTIMERRNIKSFVTPSNASRTGFDPPPSATLIATNYFQ